MELVGRLRRFVPALRRKVALFHHPAYRLPLASLEANVGFEPRRADQVAWYLLDRRIVAPEVLRTPEPISWEALARVHDGDWLESVTRPETLSRLFVAPPQEINVDALLQSLRLACGGTLAAARLALDGKGPALNLLGGFHHAGRDFGSGFCAFNDVAVAIAALRHEGLLSPSDRIVVLDLDAHAPDGTADLLANDSAITIASLSASTWPET